MSGETLQGAELTVLKGDSTILFAVIPSHDHFTLPSASSYEISVAHMGYAPYNTQAWFSNDTTLTVVLAQKTYDLDEVVVQGQSARKITATGEIFQLSSKARKSGDPFRALSEIPLLKVNIINQTVTTNAGEPLLVLIDGKLQNSGIQPIDPKFIESVEVSDVVSARFLKMGVKKLLNIKLRKNRPMYVYTDFHTRHDIPLREGFGGANYEFGRKKFPISGSIFYNYLHHDKSDFERKESSESVSRVESGETISGSHSWDGNLMMKWTPSEADYISAAVKGLTQRSDDKRNTEGQYISGADYSLDTKFRYDIKTDGYLAALYHEHTFRGNSLLTTFLKYNYSKSTLDERFDDWYDNAGHDSRVNWNTMRHQYSLNVDFDTQDKPYGDINIGNQLEYTADRDKSLLDPLSQAIDTKLWSNYTYAGYTNHWRKWFYMASVGLENLGIKELDNKNVVWRPRISTSMSWQLPHRQALRLSYNLGNTLPPSSALNLLNTSSNPMLRVEGNPYLVPEQEHLLNLNYNINLKRFWLSFVGSHTRERDIIEPYIYSDGAAQVQSYRNNGTYKESALIGRARYGGNNLMVFAATSLYIHRSVGRTVTTLLFLQLNTKILSKHTCKSPGRLPVICISHWACLISGE